MKKAITVLAALLAVILLCSCAAAEEAPDFSSMSNEEIVAWIKAGLQEMASRESEALETIYENAEQGIKLSYIGVEYQEYFSYDKHVDSIVFNGMLLNTGEKKVTATIDNVFVNNWKCSVNSTYQLEAEPGRNDRGRMNEILAVNDNAGINSLEEAKIIEGEYVITVDGEVTRIPFTYTFVK